MKFEGILRVYEGSSSLLEKELRKI